MLQERKKVFLDLLTIFAKKKSVAILGFEMQDTMQITMQRAMHTPFAAPWQLASSAQAWRDEEGAASCICCGGNVCA